MNIEEKKIEIAKKVENYERIILSLENWKLGEKLNGSKHNEFPIKDIETEEQRDTVVEMIKNAIDGLRSKTLDDYKLHLSEIVEKENIEFGSNNLIYAPVGSGKTTFVEGLAHKENLKSLMLVSNTALKDSTSPNNNEIKEIMGKRTYTTQNKKLYGEGTHEMNVMSYAEFGKKVETNDKFIRKFDIIICDEIHSLPNYQQFSDSVLLAHAIKALFKKYSGIKIFYLTATDEHILRLQKRQPEILEEVSVYDFRSRNDIKKYISLASYKIKNIDDIRPHLKARLIGFNYFGHKVLAFAKKISEMKRIEEIAIEEGYKPLVLWSSNNTEHVMSEEQLTAREYLLSNDEIPHPYNFLIINTAMQEGWNLKDKMVRLAIIYTTNETEKIQSLGRVRKDIEVLVYKDTSNGDLFVDLPIKYYNKPLTQDMKLELCSELNLITDRNKQIKWPTLKTLLKKQGYIVEDCYTIDDKKRVRASLIYVEI